jgi:hypothetical protein
MAIAPWYHFDTIVTVLHKTNGALGMDPATRPQPGGVRAGAAEGCDRLRDWRLRAGGAAVVSGAYGSVAAAVTAGIPTVHPQWSDQFWHGRQVRTLGVAVEAIERAIGTTA